MTLLPIKKFFSASLKQVMGKFLMKKMLLLIYLFMSSSSFQDEHPHIKKIKKFLTNHKIDEIFQNNPFKSIQPPRYSLT